MAFGCFTWATGDIDFLVAVEAPLTQAEKEALVRVLVDFTPDAPPKGFEMSVVLRAVSSTQRPLNCIFPTPTWPARRRSSAPTAGICTGRIPTWRRM